MKNATHISIIGSCVCRDAFSIPQATKDFPVSENEYIVDRFIQGINPLSAISDPVDEITASALINESENSSAPPFYKRCYKLDLTKGWKDYLSEVKSDYLIIDFSTVRLDCRKIDGGCVTFDDIGRTIALGIGHDAPNEATTRLVNGEAIALSDFSESELRNIYFEYMDNLLCLYPEKNIIVVDARHTRTFANFENGSIATTNHVFDQRYIRDNKLIDFAYKCAKEKLRDAHFIDSLPVLVGNVNHKWGQGGLHFVDEVYLYIYYAIDAIIHNEMDSEGEALFMYKLKEKYTKRIFDNYSATTNNYAQACRNVLCYNQGMKPGRYESNGVCLDINFDYSFVIQGTAQEDTVFYLYQAQKNPLGGWRSVQAQLEPARYAFSTKVKNQGDSFFIQLVLTDKETNKLWIKGDYTSFVNVKDPQSYQLVRAIIRKGTTVDVEGKLFLEKI